MDGAYAAFGKVTEGMDAVNKIAETATDYSDRPMEDQVMKHVTVETFGVEYKEPEKVFLDFLRLCAAIPYIQPHSTSPIPHLKCHQSSSAPLHQKQGLRASRYCRESERVWMRRSRRL